jgi:hypothetical protein
MVVVVAGLLAPVRVLAQAQAPADRAPALVRHGKWAALAAAVAMTIAGAATHQEANDDYTMLRAFCRDTGPCTIGPDGRYLDPRPEALYWEVVRADRAARAWLVGGQAALAGAVTLFIIELRHRRGAENIPFEPYIATPPGGPTLIGLRLPLRR